jgi:hypothetical protein
VTAPSLAETRARGGAPWRPLKDTGVLIKPQKKPRSAAVIFAACEQQLLSHLKAVCLWPKEERNQNWRVGDYSFYIISFNPAEDTYLYLQFWSEPDEDGAIFEVSSGARNPPADKYVDAEKQELLRDHGFEIGGKADNFRKEVTIENAKDVRAVARETVAILCKVLGYDGTLELGYKLNLETNTAVRHVLTEVRPYTLKKMLREWGFPAELKAQEGKAPILLGRTDHGPFEVFFADETKKGSRRFQTLKIHSLRKVESGKAHYVPASDNGDPFVESQVLLHGGVTPEHLRARFELWRRKIGEIAGGWARPPRRPRTSTPQDHKELEAIGAKKTDIDGIIFGLGRGKKGTRGKK